MRPETQTLDVRCGKRESTAPNGAVDSRSLSGFQHYLEITRDLTIADRTHLLLDRDLRVL